MSEDVLEVATRDGRCPVCDSRLEIDEPDWGNGTCEIQPEWCPICGWEPAE